MELHLQTLIDSINDAVVASDSEGRVIIWNPGAERLFEYRKEEAIGQKVDELVGGLKKKEAARISKKVWRRRISDLITTRYTKSGKPIAVSLSASPVVYKNYLIGGVAVYKDISELVQKDKLLAHTNKLLRAISDINQTIIMEKDPEELLSRASRSLKKDVSYNRVQIILVDEKFKPVKFIGPGRKKPLQPYPPCVERVLKNRRSLFVPDVSKSSICYKCSSKENKGWAACFLLEHNHEVLGVLSVANAQEIFDQASEIRLLEEVAGDLSLALYSIKREEEKNLIGEELEKLHQFQEKILTSLAEGVVVENAEGNITYVNPSFEKMLGYGRGDLLGKHWSIFIPEEQLDRVTRKSKARKSTTLEKYETLMKTKDGRRIPVLIHARSLFEKKRFTGVVSAITDISHIKKTQEELKASREEALSASKAKSEFLANMSHEIRTPMNGVIGMIELAVQTELTDEQHEFLTAARASAESLLTILNDILDFSKIEARMIELVPTEFNLQDSITEIVASLALAAHRKGLELLCHVPPSLPVTVVGDLGRLRQIILNLVSNAIKFTEQGEVGVEVFEESRTKKEIVLHFAVHDTGIGIPENKLQSIFQPFVQADSSLNRKYGGTGLGLAISFQLVKLMGGKIWTESKLGQGSIFHFTVKLDLPERPGKKISLASLSAFHRFRVLVIDDNATNRAILKEMLQSWRMLPEQAASGIEALGMLQSPEARKEPFELLLVDLSMPEMDGFVLIENIRKISEYQNTPIIILSSADRVGDLQRAKELGAWAYLVKPVRPSALLDTIMTVKEAGIMEKKMAQPPSEWTPSELRQKYKILLAEDNFINQKVAVHLLEKRGHQAVVVENGEQVLKKLAREEFDLVLMDIQMPVMNGFEVTQKIRDLEKESGKHLPIVAMTAHAMKGDRERCLAAGMDDYVSKPLYAEELHKAIERAWLKKK
jgi:PAS domain S-box-containing protein